MESTGFGLVLLQCFTSYILIWVFRDFPVIWNKCILSFLQTVRVAIITWIEFESSECHSLCYFRLSCSLVTKFPNSAALTLFYHWLKVNLFYLNFCLYAYSFSVQARSVRHGLNLVELSTEKPAKRKHIYSEKVLWSCQKTYFSNLPAKRETCLRWNIFPVFNDSVFTYLMYFVSKTCEKGTCL